MRAPLNIEDNDPKPIAPERPPDETCCGRGCVPCVFDYYEEALMRYEAALAAWMKRHPGG